MRHRGTLDVSASAKDDGHRTRSYVKADADSADVAIGISRREVSEGWRRCHYYDFFTLPEARAFATEILRAVAIVEKEKKKERR